MSAMSDLDVTLQLGEQVDCDCGMGGCQGGVTLSIHGNMVQMEVTGYTGHFQTVYLDPPTAQALAILLSEAGRDAAGD